MSRIKCLDIFWSVSKSSKCLFIVFICTGTYNNEFKSYYVNCFLFHKQNKTSWEEKNKNSLDKNSSKNSTIEEFKIE